MEQAQVQTLGNLLTSRADTIAVYARLAGMYFDYVSKVLFGYNVRDYDAVVGALKLIDADIVVIKAASSTPGTLTQYADVWSRIDEVDAAIKAVNAILSSEFYSRTTLYTLSQTAAGEMKITSTHLRDQYDRYIAASAGDTDTLRRALAGVDVTAEEIRALPVNKFTIVLVELAIPRHPGLISIVESQKDRVLDAARVQSTADSMLAIPVQLGLVPATRMMPRDDVFRAAGIDSTRVNVVTLTTGTRSNMEFDLRGLISPEYVTANELTVSPAAGLTKNFIRRFVTAMRLDVTPASAPVHTSAVAGAPTYVLETYDGSAYRMLSPTLTPAAADDAAVHALAHGITTRPQHYYEVLDSVITARCVDPQAATLVGDYAVEADRSSFAIKSAIIEAYVRHFTDVENLDTERYMQLLTDRKKTVDSMLPAIMMAQVPESRKELGELAVTYVSRIDRLCWQFARALENALAKFERGALDAVFTSPDSARMVADLTRQVVTGAVNEIDTKETWTVYRASLKEHFMVRKHLI